MITLDNGTPASVLRIEGSSVLSFPFILITRTSSLKYSNMYYKQGTGSAPGASDEPVNNIRFKSSWFNSVRWNIPKFSPHIGFLRRLIENTKLEKTTRHTEISRFITFVYVYSLSLKNLPITSSHSNAGAVKQRNNIYCVCCCCFCQILTNFDKGRKRGRKLILLSHQDDECIQVQ